MATRTGAQRERLRAEIKTRELIEQLQRFAFGQNDAEGNPIEIDAPRLKAIEMLLRKALPDLSPIAHLSDADRRVAIERIVREIVDPKASDG